MTDLGSTNDRDNNTGACRCGAMLVSNMGEAAFPCPFCGDAGGSGACDCLDYGHDSGDGIHCLCGGVMPRAKSLANATGAPDRDIAAGRCMAPKDPRPMVTTYMCVYPRGHDGNHSWQDTNEHRRERMKAEGWT